MGADGNNNYTIEGMPGMLAEVWQMVNGLKAQVIALSNSNANSTTLPPDKVILNTEQVAEMLGVKPSTVDMLRSRKKIKYYKPDGVVFYILADILDYVKSGAVPTDAEIKASATIELTQRKRA